MRIRYCVTAAIAAAILVSPAERAEADAKDFIAGAIVGGVLGHAARSQSQPQRKVYRSTKSAKKTYRPRIPATQEGRQIQTALNYFGFDAGSVDGQLGAKSRQAISAYQAYLGYPVTGQLNVFEQDLLISSYNRAQAGGYATQQRIAANPDGTRGLLRTYRTEMAGGTAQASTTMVAAPQAQPVQPAPVPPYAAQPGVMAAAAPVQQQTLPPIAAPASQPQVAKANGAPLPTLFAARPAAGSLSESCAAMDIGAATSFDFTASDRITDTDAALAQQFCVARGYALQTGRELGQSLGAEPEQIAQLCSVYGEQLQPYVTALGTMGRQEVLASMTDFAGASGGDAAELSGTAEVCLAHGFETDDMPLALGAALLLTHLGQDAYGELVGHHLRAGQGVAANALLAADWFESGIAAADAGSPVIAPAQPDRIAVLKRALFPIETVTIPTSGTALPTFSVAQ